MFRHALFNLVVPAALLLGVHSASAESRLALVIGQSAYKSVPALPNPINDAKSVTQMLTESGFEVSTVSDLTQSQIRDQLSEFAAKVASKGGDEQKAKQDSKPKVDEKAYKAALERIPEPKEKYDPWGVARPEPAKKPK